jgi:fused signal recognition particle receptor
MNETAQHSAEPKTGWLARLRAGLARSTGKLTQGLAEIVTKRKLDAAALEELEENLIAADLGPAAAAKLVQTFGQNRFGKEVSDHEVREALAQAMADMLRPVALPLAIDRTKKPFVVLMVGVNGTGKTTTIGKLAKIYADQGLNVMIAAGDTFRAAAIQQLAVWGERANCPVVAGAPGGDAAALAFEALQRAKADNADLLLIDTAGRLHNKTDLMNELSKIARVLKKIDDTAPHATLLVLDATTGQNAHAQLQVFRELTNVTGLIVTKLDGSAKGGVVVALAERFGLPIHAVGIGEGVDDLRPFDADDFARSLLGLTE